MKKINLSFLFPLALCVVSVFRPIDAARSAILYLSLSALSLGMPETFLRAQAMMLSRGRIAFTHCVALGLTAVATTAGALLAGRVAFLSDMDPLVVVTVGLTLTVQLAGHALRSKRDWALAALSECAGAGTLALTALFPEYGRRLLLIAEAFALIFTLLAFCRSPRAKPSPTVGLLREIPGGLFVRLYYPTLCGFALMMWMTRHSVAGLEALRQEHIVGFFAGYTLFALLKPMFRREESDTPWILALVVLLVTALTACARFTRADLEPDVVAMASLVLLAGGCALTVFYAPTAWNVVSEILWIGAGLYGCVCAPLGTIESVALLAAAAVGALAQSGAVVRAVKLVRMRRRRA